MLQPRLVPRHVFRGALLGAVCVLAPLQAAVACSSTDIAAKWRTYFRLADGAEDKWVKCLVTADTLGDLAFGTACKGRSPFGTIDLAVTGGNLAVGTNCAVTGKIEISGCKFVMQGATMSNDGAKIAGVGSVCGASSVEVFQMTAVKQ